MLFTARSQLVLQREHILLNFFHLSIEGEKMRSIGGEGCGYQFKITLTKSGPGPVLIHLYITIRINCVFHMGAFKNDH